MRHRDPVMKWEPPKVAIGYGPEVTGRGPLENRIARLIGQALRDARDDGFSRAEIARRMADYLQRPVSEATLNKWSSEGSEDHRIPFDAFIALVEATGVKSLLGFAPGEFGMTVIDQEYAEMVEDQLLDEQIRELEALRISRAARRKGQR